MPTAVVAAIAAVVGLIGLIASLVFGMMKDSEPYREAVARARADPQVRTSLGTPIADGMFPNGNINLVNDGGRANFDIPISGPGGKGTVHVVATKSAGVWSYDRLDVEIPGQPAPISLGN